MSLPNITIQISADAVAWYGAVIATIAATVSIYNAWRDRSKVILEFGRNFRRPDDWDKPLFYISVVNHGRRPVRIDKSWVTVYGYDGEALLADSLNTRQERTLDERNPKITFWTEESTLDVSNIYRISASDETGRVYQKYIKKFPTFTKLWRVVMGRKSDGVKTT
jgi:hypothetical protein